MLSRMENAVLEVSWINIWCKHTINPDMFKQPMVVILLMFLVSVTTAVKVGNKPMNNTTTTGSMVKATIIKPRDMINFWKELILDIPTFSFEELRG